MTFISRAYTIVFLPNPALYLETLLYLLSIIDEKNKEKYESQNSWLSYHKHIPLYSYLDQLYLETLLYLLSIIDEKNKEKIWKSELVTFISRTYTIVFLPRSALSENSKISSNTNTWKLSCIFSLLWYYDYDYVCWGYLI